MPTGDDITRLRLVRTEGVGPVTYRRLLDRYHGEWKGDISRIYAEESY